MLIVFRAPWSEPASCHLPYLAIAPREKESVLMRSLLPGFELRLCFLAMAVVFGEAAAAAAQQAPISRPWRFDLTTGAGYDDNVRFTTTMQASISGQMRARLTRLIRSPRANMSLGATTDGTVYRRAREFNRINYMGDLSANYLLSPRSTLRIADAFSKTFTGDSPVLVDDGLLYPRTVSHANDASIGMTHLISPRWNWTVSVRHRIVRFDSNLLNDGSSFVTRADLSWASASDAPVGLSYEYGRVNRRGQPSVALHGPTLRASRPLSERFSARLEVGARSLASLSSVSAIGAAGIVVSSRNKNQAVQLDAVRSVSEAFGLDRLQVRSAASLRFSRTLTSSLALGLNGNVSRSQDPNGVQNLSFVTRVLGGSLKFRVASNVGLSAAGGYRIFDPVAGARTHSRFLTLNLNAGQDW